MTDLKKILLLDCSDWEGITLEVRNPSYHEDVLCLKGQIVYNKQKVEDITGVYFILNKTELPSNNGIKQMKYQLKRSKFLDFLLELA